MRKSRLEPRAGAHGSDRLHGHTAGEVGQPAPGLLIDGRAAIGMVVDDERLAALGEGSELVEIGVLDRLCAVRGFPVPGWPDAVVGIGEDQLTSRRCRQRPPQPAAPPGPPAARPGGPDGRR
jgi:hypothetical protein